MRDYLVIYGMRVHRAAGSYEPVDNNISEAGRARNENLRVTVLKNKVVYDIKVQMRAVPARVA